MRQRAQLLGISRRRALAGTAALIACLQYSVAEALAAASWRHPSYSYVTDYISDLGIPCRDPNLGAALCSPAAAVMNAGFVMAGLLCVVAAELLRPLLPRRWQGPVLALTAVHGAGSILVGLVHSAPGTAAGTPTLHLIGAYLAVLGGNFALLAVGAALWKQAPAWLWGASLGLGVIGFAGATVLVARPTAWPGLWERVAVDTVTVWEILAGFALMAVLLPSSRPATL